MRDNMAKDWQDYLWAKAADGAVAEDERQRNRAAITELQNKLAASENLAAAISRDCNNTALERNGALAAIAELVDALEGAKEMVCEWAAYADYKSQAKWDLIGDIAKLERTIKKYQHSTKELK